MNKTENQLFVKTTYLDQANVRLTRLAGRFAEDMGASHCDFRYTRRGEPHRLVEQYPERIRFVQIESPKPSAG